MVEILSFIGLLIPLFTTIMSEFFSARSRARELNAKFQIDKKLFLEFADKALLKMREEVASDNRQVGNGQDTIDDELNKK